MDITLLGIGGGLPATLTQEAADALAKADLLIGAPRVLASLPEGCAGERKEAIRTDEILALLQEAEVSRAAVVFSGDSGFYSGARPLVKKLEEAGLEYVVLPGLSSIQLLAAKLGRPWQDWRLVSAHGLDADPVWEVCQGKPVFFLTGGTWCPGDICAALAEAGLGELPVVIAEKLSYPDEVVHCGCAADFAGAKYDSLSVLLAESAPRAAARTGGWPDEAFDREEKVPMTKQEVRSIVLSKLSVRPEETVWDIGSGSGSVSIELAFAARSVWGCEVIEDALALSRRNREKFGAWNLHLVGGSAPEILADFPAPDAVFIGGSRGNMGPIVDAVQEKNPNARILISAIALESLHEAMDVLTKADYSIEVTQVAVSRAKPVGRLHLMMANNPIFLILGTKQEN